MKLIKSTLCWDCYTKINLLYCSAQLWARKIGGPCSIEDARTLYVKYVCKNHFLETDFTTPERNRLNRGAVPCSSDSASQEPTPQLPDSALRFEFSTLTFISPEELSCPATQFQDRQIVTVYDPPHLLKCTRNLFLKYDVQFESERIHNRPFVTAKWEHILNVYKWVKQKTVRLLYKLTDAHLAPVAQDAMKVSLAAQVMSHTVGATVNSVSSEGKEHCSAFTVFVMRRNIR